MIDHDGTLLGIIAAADIEQALAGPTRQLTAASLIHTAPELRADQSLEDGVRALAASDDDGVPVLDAEGDGVVGWLTHRRLLRAYNAHLDGH